MPYKNIHTDKIKLFHQLNTYLHTINAELSHFLKHTHTHTHTYGWAQLGRSCGQSGSVSLTIIVVYTTKLTKLIKQCWVKIRVSSAGLGLYCIYEVTVFLLECYSLFMKQLCVETCCYDTVWR